MNAAGYLRLMVADPLAMNMSNTLRNVPGVKAPGAQSQAKASQSSKRKGSYFLFDLPPVRRALLWLYDSIFRWYYDR